MRALRFGDLKLLLSFLHVGAHIVTRFVPKPVDIRCVVDAIGVKSGLVVPAPVKWEPVRYLRMKVLRKDGVGRQPLEQLEHKILLVAEPVSIFTRDGS